MKAFTLLELIVVVIIVAVLASLALPQIRRTIERVYANQAAKQLGTVHRSIQRCLTSRSVDVFNYNIGLGSTCFPQGSSGWGALDIDNPFDASGSRFTFGIPVAGAGGVPLTLRYYIYATNLEGDGRVLLTYSASPFPVAFLCTIAPMANESNLGGVHLMACGRYHGLL